MASPLPRPELQIEFYERLIYKHSSRIVGVVEMDFDDIRAVYRIKVWRALESYDPSRSRLPVERYVFTCLKNMEKDLLKKKRRGELFIEDIAPDSFDPSATKARVQSRDHFEARYLAGTEVDPFAEVEEEELLLPSTLSKVERRIVVLLYYDFTQTEIRRLLGVERSEMDRRVKSIRLKFEDWRPTGAVPTPLPAQPAPQALPVAA